MRKMVEIGRAENGYVIETYVPLKKKKDGDKEGPMPYYESEGSCEKKYVAKDIAEAVSVASTLLPMLDDEFSSEDEFDMAFKKAAGSAA